MSRELEFYEKVERSIIKKYRKQLWTPFIAAVKRYELVLPGDRIAVCISGGKDSMLMAKLFQELHRHTEIPFELVFLCMDPGYNAVNRAKIESNAALLHIPLTIFETNIFDIANNSETSPCYVCARMRRGHLYKKAQELGCNKIALGHHFSDVIETTVMAMFYGSQLQAMPPKLHSKNFPGMELIRPLYCIHEDDILAWRRYNELEFIQCACRFTENCTLCDNGGGGSKRQEIKGLLRRLKRDNPNIEKSVFSSIHSVCLDTFPGYKTAGQEHSFLEGYDRKGQKEGAGVDYPLLDRQLRLLAEEDPGYIPLLSNAAAVLYDALPALNWAGFYLMRDGRLVLGPFQGKPACIHIALGKGVCGTAAAEDRTLRVPDVHQFPGHIACDSASNSEIVIPLHAQGQVIGVLDIDSPQPDRFSEADQAGLEMLARTLEAAIRLDEGGKREADV